MILLNPGPVTLSARVRRALTEPDLCHREPEFAHLQASIRQSLLDVYGLAPADWAAVLLAGSGTAAVEAMLSTLVSADGKLLVIENGVYGERMTAIASAHGMAYERLSYAWGEQVKVSDLDHILAANSDISHVALVHHETTTGRLNRLDGIAQMCRARGAHLLVDAVSSFGAEALDIDGHPMAGIAATANKCLHGAPGVSFVIVRRDQLPRASRRSVYLDLAAYCREQDRQGTPFTQPVQIFYALREALNELEEQGGWQARGERYAGLALRVRAGLSRLGIEPLLPENETSVVLSAYQLPSGISYEFLHDALKARGFIIYAGQGALARKLFRIAVMGEISEAEVDRLIDAFREILESG